ncbi:MAG: tetratricopeptide repeat protein [Planctomycetes bacterium]|nr:tetratricopeptide repeat protein [Planctomycetota bacterium]
MGGLVTALVALSVGLVLAVRNARIARDATQQAQADAQRVRDTLADLELVSGFQGEIINSVDLAEMGKLVIDNVLSQIESESQQPGLRAALVNVNPATLARTIVDGSFLSKASTAAAEQFKGRPLIEAQIRDALTQSYFAVALYEPSLREAKAALALRREHLGEDHLETIKSIGLVGHILLMLSQFDEAELYQQDALRRFRAQLPENDKRVLEARDRIIMIKMGREEFDEAFPLSEALLGEAEKVLPPDDDKLLTYRQHLMMLCVRTGQLETALTQSQALLEAFKAKYGEDNLRTLACWTHVAGTLGRLNRFAEAEAMYADLYDRTQRILGELDPRTLRIMHNLGTFRARQGRTKEALETFRDLLVRQRKSLPPDHPELADTIEALKALEETAEKNNDAPAE